MSSRSIVVILEILNECFKGELFDSIPCNQVIEDWCEKAGLDMHTKVKDQFVDNEYITITDESISANQRDGSFGLLWTNPDVDVLSFESFFVSLHCWNGFGG